MIRALALPALLAACAGRNSPPSEAPRQFETGAGAAVAAPSANVAPATTEVSACRAPWNGPAKDPRFSPKPLLDVAPPGRLASSEPTEVAYAHARHEFAAAQWDRAATGRRRRSLPPSTFRTFRRSRPIRTSVRCKAGAPKLPAFATILDAYQIMRNVD